MKRIHLYDLTIVVTLVSGTEYKIKCDNVREAFATMYQIAGIQR